MSHALPHIAICPTVTAFSVHEYAEQMALLRRFASHVHLDVMDGTFAPTVSPGLDEVWWPPELTVDIHLMYQRPMDHIKRLVRLKPRMVIIHAEADVHHMHFAAELHKQDIMAGLSILHDTPVHNVKQIMHSFDHLLLFSGHLGYHGGEADMGVLDKAREALDYYPDIELGWDGGINDANARQLIAGGVTVLNVGGYIHKSDNPSQAYATLEAIAKGTN